MRISRIFPFLMETLMPFGTIDSLALKAKVRPLANTPTVNLG